MKNENSRIIKYNGEKHDPTERSNILGIKHSVLLARILKLGWSCERAFTAPIRRCCVDKSV